MLCTLAQARPADEPPPMDVKFRCLGWRLSPEHPFEFFSEGEWVAINDLNTFHRSLEPYHYVGPNPVVFYMKNAADERVPVCQVDLSGDFLEPLLLFTKVKSADPESPRYHALLFEDHDSRFPPGSFHFINLTRMELSGKIGDSTFQLAPGKQLNVTPSLPPSQRAVHFLLATREASGALRPLKSTYMQYDADTKHLTFVLPHPNGRGNVNTFTITEAKKPDREEK